MIPIFGRFFSETKKQFLRCVFHLKTIKFLLSGVYKDFINVLNLSFCSKDISYLSLIVNFWSSFKTCNYITFKADRYRKKKTKN